MSHIPEGFALHTRRSPLTTPWEPIHAKITPDAFILGLILAEPHTNSRGMAHGGLIAALADNAMGLSCGMQLTPPASIVTANLSVDYFGMARLGQWLAFETNFLKIGGSLCFAGLLVTADGVPIARASASFKR
jgi:acyl-coenzyme A thioesterase PaaI-like protein